MTILIIVAGGVAVAALAAGVGMMFLRTDEGTAVEDRLEALTGKGKGSAKKKEVRLLSEALDSAPGAIERMFSRFGSVKVLLEQAGSSMSPSKLFLVCGALAGAGALACMVHRSAMLAAPVAALCAGSLPLLWIFFKRKRRIAAFGKQLPEALELMSRALRAGHSLAAGFQLVAEEMQGPLGPEFGRCYEEQNFGIALDDALRGMTQRVPNLDLRFFSTAVILQRQTGGDLAEILDKIGRLVRERFQIWGQIQALTGEGRLSGIVLLALPPVLFLVMLKINYNYIIALFEDPMGKQMLAGGIVMQLLGAIVIKKIITIKV